MRLKNLFMNKKSVRLVSLILVVFCVAAIFGVTMISNAASSSVTTIDNTDEVKAMMAEATSYVLVRHKQLGASHYAYTEAVSDDWGVMGTESVFRPGSMLCLVTFSVNESNPDKVDVKETILIRSPSGVIRDPDVSEDGTKVVFSHKKNDRDDFHLYELDLTTGKQKQLTYGSGVADIEPVYTGNGTIIFNSTRDIQTVDCWYTPVSNLYMCNTDGTGIVRLGYDQVHTTYPTASTDGRILYTRWDYNDRNQMYVQALFQMFPDGTGQTELFGNNANNPTTLLHTREIPGSSTKYITIISGHHMNQVGKLAIVDTSKGRNELAAVSYVRADAATRQLSSGASSVDNSLFQEGTVYKYPYALTENLFTVAMSDNYGGRSDANFDIVLMTSKGKTQTIVKGQTDYPASQFVPVKSEELFTRSSMVNYAGTTGTYYVADVYMGEGMKNVKRGTVKYLRVVALSFRPYAIGATVGGGTGSSDPYSPIASGNGAWDVKQVLGIVPVEEDGSALFKVPSETPVYFQLLDENGDMIQTMRSWSTLQPGEYFSCVGCHLDKNTAPSSSLTVSEAMKKGVQDLQPDLWMKDAPEYENYDPYNDEYIGFDYLEVVQPILDRSCVTCHSNTQSAFNRIEITKLNDYMTQTDKASTVFDTDVEWDFTKVSPAANWMDPDFDSSAWDTDTAPFGQVATAPGKMNTIWKDTDTLWLRRAVNMTQYDVEAGTLQLYLAHSGSITVYVNGTEVYNSTEPMSEYGLITISGSLRDAFEIGENVIAVKVTGTSSGRYFGLGLMALAPTSSGTILDTRTLVSKGAEWTYYTSASDELGTSGDWTQANYNTSSWKKAKAPLGDRIAGGPTSDWTNDSPYLWARYEFNISDADVFKNVKLQMEAFYDDDIVVYINGKQIYSHDKWNDGYTKYDIDEKVDFVNGKNVIAVRLLQHTGGYEWDAEFTVNILDSNSLTSNAPISFENIGIYASRMQKNFPLSYLVLTGSKPNSGIQWVGESNNRYTRYISSMSQCEVLQANSAGAKSSAIIKKLRNGHGDLTDEEIAAIACWIDLAVPCFGTYNPEGSTEWSDDAERKAIEDSNKRHIYDVLDRYAKLERGGVLPEGEITLTYRSQTATGRGYAVIYTDVSLSVGSKITVTLPEGQKYFALSLSARLGEAILYCPTGKFEMTIPAGFNNVVSSYFSSMTSSTVVARILSEKELTTVHNLAYNPYDISELENTFPHVEASRGAGIINQGRNVIDGYVSNLHRGSFPTQAWQPGDTFEDSDYLTINYGREVTLNELIILTRNATSDTYFTSCTVEFSDGTEIELSLKKSLHEQHFDIGSINTTYVKFKNFVLAEQGKTAAITEIQTMGVEKLG